jgi:hypothetical protein
MNGLKRFILWDYPRAGWQYDVIVAVILVFIFATPREWFRDQPKASNIVLLPAGHGSSQNVFWIEPELLAGVQDAARTQKAADLLQTKTGKKQPVARLEPIFDAEQEIKGYMAFTSQ